MIEILGLVLRYKRFFIVYAGLYIVINLFVALSLDGCTLGAGAVAGERHGR